MLLKYCDGLILLLFGLLFPRFNAVAEGEEKFRIEGRAHVYGVRTEEWTPLARVLLDGEEHVGFVRLKKKERKKEMLQCHAPATIYRMF